MSTKQPSSEPAQKKGHVVITTPESTLTRVGAITSILTAVFTGLAVAVYLYQYGLMRQQLTAADRNRTLEGIVIAVSDICRESVQYVSAVEQQRVNNLQDYDAVFQKEIESGKSKISAEHLKADGAAMQKTAKSAIDKLPDLQTASVRFRIFANEEGDQNVLQVTDRIIRDVRDIGKYDARLYLTTPSFLAKVYQFGRNCLAAPSLLENAARDKPTLPLLDVTVQ